MGAYGASKYNSMLAAPNPMNTGYGYGGAPMSTAVPGYEMPYYGGMGAYGDPYGHGSYGHGHGRRRRGCC